MAADAEALAGEDADLLAELGLEHAGPQQAPPDDGGEQLFGAQLRRPQRLFARTEDGGGYRNGTRAAGHGRPAPGVAGLSPCSKPVSTLTTLTPTSATA